MAKTEYYKLKEMLEVYQKILHPDVFNPIMKQIGKVYAEATEEAFAKAKISDSAREIEALFEKTFKDLDRDKHLEETSFARLRRWRFKMLYRDLLSKFNQLYANR